MKENLMIELLEKQMPPKSYFVMGSNWNCYIESKKEDLENLNDDDFKVEVCTRAVEVFLGMSQNDTLAIPNKEDEPMIGVVMAVTERGKEDDDESYSFVPSHLCFGNCGQYKTSAESFEAYDKFLNFIEEEKKKAQETSKTKPKKTKKVKPLPPKKED
jgi:hypothetical protein